MNYTEYNMAEPLPPDRRPSPWPTAICAIVVLAYWWFSR